LSEDLIAEHQATRALAIELAGLKASDSMWRAKPNVIVELASTNFAKEETIVIPHAPELFSMSALDALGAKFEEIFKKESSR
jgi:hypothetical protein